MARTRKKIKQGNKETNWDRWGQVGKTVREGSLKRTLLNNDLN